MVKIVSDFSYFLSEGIGKNFSECAYYQKLWAEWVWATGRPLQKIVEHTPQFLGISTVNCL
jgi:hypothetical protein